MEDKIIANVTKKMLSEKALICVICKNVLSPPVMIVKNLGNLCHFCFDTHKEDEWIYLENTELNTILSELKFPCKYESEGCDVITKYEDFHNHKNKCIFRVIKCFSPQNECDWNGKLKDIWEHFKEDHSKHVINSPNDSFSFEYNISNSTYMIKLLRNKNKTYMFKVKEIDQNGTATLLNFLYDMESASEDFNLISYSGANGQYKIKAKRLRLDMDDESNGTKIPLNILTEIAGISGNITVSVKPNKYQLRNINGQILKQLECPVCKELMRPPIHQCTLGHSMCGNCRPNLKECPTCRQALSNSRNFALEDITPFVHYQCTYYQYGCEASVLGSDIDQHEGICTFKIYTCPIANCTFKGNYVYSKNHFEVHHPDFLNETTTYQEYFVQNTNTQNIESVRYLFEHNNIYKLLFVRGYEKCTWTVRILNKYDEREKFYYEISIVHPSVPQKRVVKSTLCLNIDTEAKDSDIITLTYNELTPYKNVGNNDQIVYYCKILKH